MKNSAPWTKNKKRPRRGAAGPEKGEVRPTRFRSGTEVSGGLTTRSWRRRHRTRFMLPRIKQRNALTGHLNPGCAPGGKPSSCLADRLPDFRGGEPATHEDDFAPVPR